MVWHDMVRVWYDMTWHGRGMVWHGRDIFFLFSFMSLSRLFHS